MSGSNIIGIYAPNAEKRLFVKTYIDFLENGFLTCEEQMVFIALKSFIDVTQCAGTCYKTRASIGSRAKLTEKKVTQAVKGLVRKGVLKRIRQGLTKPNLYEINDIPEMWEANTPEEVRAAAEETELQKALRLVKAAGYEVKKEKGLPAVPATGSQTQDNTKLDVSSLISDSSMSEAPAQDSNFTKSEPNQGKVDKSEEKYALEAGLKGSETDLKTDEKGTADADAAPDPDRPRPSGVTYSEEIIKDFWEYDRIEAPETLKEMAVHVAYKAINTRARTIRIHSKEENKDLVISVLTKLDAGQVSFALHQFEEAGRTGKKIGSPDRYLLTLLYDSYTHKPLSDINEANRDGY